MRHFDLTKKEGSIGNLLCKNYNKLMALHETSTILSSVKNMLSEANIDTPASRRLLSNLTKSRNHVNSLSIIANTVLAAQGNKVI